MNRNIFWIILPVVFVLLGLAGGVLIFLDGLKGEDVGEEIVIPLPIALEITKEVEEAATPKLDRFDLKIRILNGKGVSGTASVAQEYLSGLGYEVVSTGNADNFNFSKTEIFLKESKADFKKVLNKDLSDGYRVSNKIGSVDEDQDFDAVVIIGAE